VGSEPGTGTRPRIAVFTHDTYGLGHVQRSRHIIRALAARLPRASILLVTGSPAVHLLQDLPPHADFVKIPTAVKTGSRKSAPSHLSLSWHETTALRSRIVHETVLTFDPDLFLVDNFPLGSQGELLRTLQALRGRATRTCLGMRDILDAPEVIRSDWERQGIYDVLERYYDRILIYGTRDVFDVVEGYAIPEGTAARVRYCGYLTGPTVPGRTREELRRDLGVDGSFLLAMGGGGGDAYPLLNTFVRALPRIADSTALVLTGPLMGTESRRKLRGSARKAGARVKILDFVPDIQSHLAAADVVVSMCGYNSAAEIVVQRPKAIVVPRTWRYGEHENRSRTSEEREQLMRAQALARLGLADLMEPQDVSPEALAHRITRLMQASASSEAAPLDVGGLDAAVRELLDLLEPTTPDPRA
jgi:predicted glycosyltransferase